MYELINLKLGINATNDVFAFGPAVRNKDPGTFSRIARSQDDLTKMTRANNREIATENRFALEKTF